MQSLKNVQTWAKVFKVFTIISIVFLSIGIVGALIGFIVLNNEELFNQVNLTLVEMGENEVTTSILAIILVSIVIMGASLALEIMFLKYLNKELADRTPFTFDGAKQLFWLGIISIMLSVVVSIISFIIVTSYGISMQEIDNNTFNVSYIGYGIGLIFISQIFKYGADVKAEKKND